MKRMILPLALLAAATAGAAGTPAIENDTYRRDPANLFVEKGYGMIADYYVGGNAFLRRLRVLGNPGWGLLMMTSYTSVHCYDRMSTLLIGK